MNEGTKLDRIAAAVAKVRGRDRAPAVIERHVRLVDAGMTSLDMVNLMLAIEAEFDIMIPAGEITPGNFRSIATIEAMVARVSPPPAA